MRLHYVLCVVMLAALADSAAAQIRRLPPVRQPLLPAQPQKQGVPLQGQLTPIPVQQPGNVQVQGNITYARQPTWRGENTFNGQLMPPLGANPFAAPAFPQMNPYATPLSPLANPYANPLSPYANPLSPYANPLSPYANPLLNPLVNPYSSNGLNPMLNRYPMSPLQQQILLQQMQMNAIQQQLNNPLGAGLAPVVGVGQSGFAVGR